MKLLKHILAGIFLFTAAVYISGKPAHAAAVHDLEPGHRYTKYDITGDSKKDTIMLKTPDEYDAVGEIDEGNYSNLQVYVNGECALTIDNFSYHKVESKMILLDNNKSYLYIHLGVGDGYGPDMLYAYSGGKLIKEINFEQDLDNGGYSHSVASIQAVKNSINLEMSTMSYGLGPMSFEAKYVYQSGKLRLYTKTHKITWHYYSGGNSKAGTLKLTAAHNIQLYKTKQRLAKTKVLPKGTKVKVTKYYISGKKVSFYVQGWGWFRSPKNPLAKPLFKEVVYAG